MDIRDIEAGSVLVIDGEGYEIEKVSDSYAGAGRLVECGNMEWYIYEDSDKAGREAEEYWLDMAHSDPEEFAAIIGTERLIQWGLGQSDDYGISSVTEFAERNAEVPEENWASYDGVESDATVKIAIDSDGNPAERTYEDGEKFEEMEVVAYRHN